MADALEKGIESDAFDHLSRPANRSAIGASWDHLFVQPIRHFLVAGPLFQHLKPLLINGFRQRIFVDILLPLGTARFDIAVDFALKHSALRKAISQCPADPLGRIAVVAFVFNGGEEGIELPTFAAGIDVVVQGDQTSFRIFARFAKNVRVNSTADAAQILADHQVKLAAFDKVDCLGKRVAVDTLPTSLAGDDYQFVGKVCRLSFFVFPLCSSGSVVEYGSVPGLRRLVPADSLPRVRRR